MKRNNHIKFKSEENGSISSGAFFHKRGFWMAVFIPPLIITSVIFLLCYIAKDFSAFEGINAIQVYFSFCAGIFIIALLIFVLVRFCKDFAQSSVKGKAFLIALVMLFLLKAIYELSRMSN